jgi:hypothetical protein
MSTNAAQSPLNSGVQSYSPWASSVTAPAEACSRSNSQNSPVLVPQCSKFFSLTLPVLSFPADVQAYGPLTQTQLLGQLGINARVEALLENASEEQAEALEQEYMRLVGDHPGDEAAQKPPGMGDRYKAVAIVKKGQGLPFPFT